MWLQLDGDGPLYRQAYRALRAAILDGRLPAGERLPSSRVLAREAKLARNTVLQAYEQLVAEGYAESRRGAGTYVVSELPDAAARRARAPRTRAPAAPAPLSAYAARAVHYFARGVSWGRRRPAPRYDFRYGDPAYDDFPHATWCRLLARRARRASERHLSYSDPGGAPELREALAGYLARARGVACEAEDVLVVYGTQQAIDLTARVLIDPGARVIVEEPGYPGIRHALEIAGAEVTALAVDEDGLPTDELAGQRARLACVTPSHQFPTGGVLPLARRLALLAWAERVGAFVLEDDYDGEFRYDGRPLESLQALDRSGRVLYAGTVSKVMFPALRIGYLVMPRALREALIAAKAFADTGTAQLEQRVLADFIAQGFFERHLRRARVRNAARRRALLAALTRELGDAVEVVGANAGLHVVAWLGGVLPGELRTLRELAAKRDVGIHPISPFYAARPRRAGILLGYAALDEAAIGEGIHRLALALREMRSR
jgi:GntR family transcriptional regulator / MocR family aminotransferase